MLSWLSRASSSSSSSAPYTLFEQHDSNFNRDGSETSQDSFTETHLHFSTWWPIASKIIAAGALVLAAFGIFQFLFPYYYDPPPQIPAPLDPTSASRALFELYTRQSRTVNQARARYTLRNSGREPPDHYDEWFKFARERRCLIDEYDQVAKDFEPFYQAEAIQPGYFRKSVKRAMGKWGLKVATIRRGHVRMNGWRIGHDAAWRKALRRVSDMPVRDIELCSNLHLYGPSSQHIYLTCTSSSTPEMNLALFLMFDDRTLLKRCWMRSDLF